MYRTKLLGVSSFSFALQPATFLKSFSCQRFHSLVSLVLVQKQKEQLSALQPIMSAESSFAQRISPQSTAGECLPLKDVSNSTVDLTNASPKAAESNTQVNKESEQELLTEVARTWTAGKSTRQTPECKAAVKRARERGLATSRIAKYVVLQLNQRNQPSAGEEERVKFSAYNVNKELKKEKEKNQQRPKRLKNV